MSEVFSDLDPKPPESEEYFSWDFRGLLLPGDTIVSVLRVYVSKGDRSLQILTTPPALDAATQTVQVKIGGGRRGTKYEVTCLVRTTLGETLAFPIEILCA